ncbi:MAG: hypothetical protein JST26_05330 [Bacteroidetes bacterium]|nr:hypothetical protein [Bacteroidota bacterium]
MSELQKPDSAGGIIQKVNGCCGWQNVSIPDGLTRFGFRIKNTYLHAIF